MVIPRSLLLFVLFLGLAFGSVLGGIVFRHRRLDGYEKLELTASPEAGRGGAFSGVTSYQNSASTDYALPENNKQKVVTYCVIDGRLVDS
jgi:hypothetical protein